MSRFVCRRLFSLCVLVLFSLFFCSQTASASVLAIDYGSEFIKASVIKPGVPFDVLLNRDSKRKIHASVSWKGDDRLFGADAFNIATRFPKDSFSYLKTIQGAPFDSPAVDYYKSISSADLVRTTRDTVSLRRPNGNGTTWSVEELIGMQFAYIKELAESLGTAEGGVRDSVKDVVLAVPPHFTQLERDALVDALEIAGLRLLTLVNDGTAVALNYAMTRTFVEEKEWHIVYDAGAAGVRATVVSFATVPAEPKVKGIGAGTTGKDSTQITVAGVGFDRGAGGLELDRRLRDMLARDFNAKHKRDITRDVRGMAKLWKEASRLKAVLSANTEASATVESVAFDIDYRSKISRADFEAACVDLQTRFSQPIFDALVASGVRLADIGSVILTGGHSRVPMVQAAVRAAVGAEKIATSVNADEAAVLGAALYGASVSRQFRTRDFRVVDIVPYDVAVAYQTEAKPVDGVAAGDLGGEREQTPMKAPKTINTLVFPAGSKVGSKKTLTFKRRDDFSLKMAYKGSVGAGLPTDLLEADISGVRDALAELTEAGAIEPVVKATVVLSESGFAGVQDVVAYGEVKKEGFAGKLKNFFGGGAKDSASESETEAEAEAEKETTSAPSSSSADPDDVSSSTTSSAAASKSPTTENEKKEKKKEVRDTIPLKLNVKPLSIPALSPMEMRRARDRLIAVDTAEAAKRRREEARNSLEGYLYRMRHLLEEDDTNPFKKCSKAEERREIQAKVEETLLWMHEEGDEAKMIDFWDKRDAVERLERPIQHRYTEIEAFPSTLNNSQRINWTTRLFLFDARQNLTTDVAEGRPAKYTPEELDTMEKSLKEHEAWLDEWVEKQKAVNADEDPVILTTEMKARAKTLENALMKLVRRKAPKVRETKTSSSPASSSSTPSSSSPSSSSESSEGTSSTATSEPTSASKRRDEL